MTHEHDSQSLLELAAHLEDEVHELRGKLLAMDVETLGRLLAKREADLGATVSAPIMSTPEPSPILPLAAPTQVAQHIAEPAPQHTTLAENSLVQLLVSHAPWEYQQMLLNGLHKVPANRKTLFAAILVVAGALYSMGYLHIPPGLLERVQAQYKGFACSAPVVTVDPLPQPMPTQPLGANSNGSQTAPQSAYSGAGGYTATVPGSH